MIETRAHFGYMLAGLIVLWLMAPFVSMASSDAARIVLDLAIGVALCLGSWTLSKERRFFLVAAGLTVAAMVCVVVGYSTGSVFAKVLVLILQVIFWVMCAWFVGRHTLRRGPVDLNRIAGGICIYMIAAVVWALLYTLLIQFDPDSFKGLDSIPFESQLAELLYFSFVTLTTLGYGDVTPLHPLARWLAQAQAVFGQLYIAILIASLVGMWIASATSRDGTDD